MVVLLHGELVCADESQAEAVRAHLARHVELTRAEPGCLEFLVEPASPLRWHVRERFTDADAFRAHQARAATGPWAEATAGVERRYEITGLD